jgi:hypothetical protein
MAEGREMPRAGFCCDGLVLAALTRSLALLAAAPYPLPTTACDWLAALTVPTVDLSFGPSPLLPHNVLLRSKMEA